MIHSTFRSLDDPPKLVWFTIKQWLALIAGVGGLAGFVHVASIPTRPAITLGVFVIGLPAALAYLSESGGLQLSMLLRSMCRWRARTQLLTAAGSGDEAPRKRVVLVERERLTEQPHLREQSSGEVEDKLAWERWD